MLNAPMEMLIWKKCISLIPIDLADEKKRNTSVQFNIIGSRYRLGLHDWRSSIHLELANVCHRRHFFVYLRIFMQISSEFRFPKSGKTKFTSFKNIQSRERDGVKMMVFSHVFCIVRNVCQLFLLCISKLILFHHWMVVGVVIIHWSKTKIAPNDHVMWSTFESNYTFLISSSTMHSNFNVVQTVFASVLKLIKNIQYKSLRWSFFLI